MSQGSGPEGPGRRAAGDGEPANRWAGTSAVLPGGDAIVPPEIVAEGFGWTYRGRARPALAGLTFRIAPGQALLVIGPSGSGKSTLARALTGLVPHELPGTWSGTLRVGDLDVAVTPTQLVSGRTGIVFQEPESQMVMPRVEDEVAFGLENRGWERQAMRARVREMLGVVGLAGFERRSTVTLSGGEQQRLAIADVLAPMPGLLVLDEPTANLDPPGMEGVFERLQSLVLSRERTVVIVEHRLEAALPLADQVLLLDGEGRQLAVGEPGEVGRAHARTLELLGSWVPRAWQAWTAGPGGVQAPSMTTGGGRAAVRSSAGPGPGPMAVPPAAGGSRGDGSRVLGRPHPLLRAREITVRYPAAPGGSRDPAISGVTLDLRAGERVALVGPNGSGKSSLLFVLAGIRRPDAGSVREGDGTAVPDVDTTRLRGGELARLLGFVFQNPELGFVGRTCAAEVAAGLPALGRVPDPEDPGVVAALEQFGLAPLAAQDPFRVSEGEQRRLGIAAASIARPSILLLDEPTFALDRRGADAVVDLLDHLRLDGQAQVLATHDPRLVPGCDRVIALDRGRVVFDGAPAAFLADPPYSPPGPWRDGAALPDGADPSREPYAGLRR